MRLPRFRIRMLMIAVAVAVVAVAIAAWKMHMVIGSLMMLAWAGAVYCQARTWTPNVRSAWDQRCRSRFTLPGTSPPRDLLGPEELVWYGRMEFFGGLFLLFLVLLIIAVGFATS